MASITFPLPTATVTQQLVGVVYAEASVGDTPAHQAEKKAIALCFLNMAYYAVLKKPNGNPCYNDSFGDGTVINAIQRGAVAYGQTRWKEVMEDSDAMKSKARLEAALDDGKVKHLQNCVDAAKDLPTSGGPTPSADLGNKNPLQFNQGSAAPNPRRQETIGKLNVHRFYAFTAGHECE